MPSQSYSVAPYQRKQRKLIWLWIGPTSRCRFQKTTCLGLANEINSRQRIFEWFEIFSCQPEVTEGSSWDSGNRGQQFQMSGTSRWIMSEQRHQIPEELYFANVIFVVTLLWPQWLEWKEWITSSSSSYLCLRVCQSFVQDGSMTNSIHHKKVCHHLVQPAKG